MRCWERGICSSLSVPKATYSSCGSSTKPGKEIRGLLARTLWRVLWPAARALAVWFPYSLVSRSPLPKGAFVAVINHFSLLDPPVAAVALRRPVRFIALDEIWGVNPLLDLVLNASDTIPIPRSGPSVRPALKSALEHLESGHPLAIFPEGRRVKAWGDAPLHPGAAWMAIQARVPVVPVAIWGSGKALSMDSMRIRRAAIRVMVGEAIHSPSYMDCQDPVGTLNEAIRQVLDRQIGRLEASFSPEYWEDKGGH
ncbi:MAG: 1-acyl-sn-glycerol-3-phosphate acyltransferase [Acidimicrobiia bacterium]|nr:1-acyl-sn-glycerol-3-phosphate acyltransferase [Acidimicrobiia bacterium]MYD03857.1 1-acyl-sn-glycerol-3-phosphate acyltransferase [Acidimicrobiia bacterium]MYF25850.1 1-acyl-sn-glycerol-3-phosphate acyltransferase [Acidimicrobiia bacterium]